MGGDYSNSLFKQYTELMERFDSLEAAHKEERTEIRSLRADVKSLQKSNAILEEKNERLETENKELHKKVDTLENENRVLREDNERIINNDSSNSSLPPSSDGGNGGGRPANTYNSRQKTGKKKGGQSGHKGTTLTRKDVEEKIRSGLFEKRTETVGDTGQKEYIIRYRIDLDIKAVATEIRIYPGEDGKYHIPEELRSEVVYGPVVKAMATQLYSEGVMANDRIGDFINSISRNALGVSAGSIYNFCREFSNRCIPENEKIKDSILAADVAGTDATVITTNKKNTYIRNVSTEDAVFYYSADNKKLETLRTMDLLVKFAGIFVHDHETALYHFGLDHAECNVHLARYLLKNTEETGNSWSHHMACFLAGMNHARKKRKEAGFDHFDAKALTIYEARYDAILEEGLEQNKKTKGEPVIE